MSIVGLPKYLPAYAGFGFAKEVDTLYRLLTKPKRPFVVIVGGAKISDKVEAVAHLARIANVVLVGGGVTNNFLAADGYDIANSYLQDCPIDIAKENSNFVHFAGKLISKTKWADYQRWLYSLAKNSVLQLMCWQRKSTIQTIVLGWTLWSKR